jgi:molecular chaperone GrpE
MHGEGNVTDEKNQAAPDGAQQAATAEQPVDGAAQSDLAAQLAAAEKQAKDYLEGWQRERSDFANYKRRVERESKDSLQNAQVQVLTKILPIIDDFERAMANTPAELKENPWLNGVGMVHRKLVKLLEENNVAIIDPVGEVFDPSRHEAVGTDESGEVESGHVAATLQKGYLYGERVLRPALVRVAK